MANVRASNTIYVDATGTCSASEKGIKVAYVVFTPDAANDQLILRDKDATGNKKLNIRGATAKETLFFDFSYAPIHFANGIYIDTLTAGAVATLVTTTSGGE
jgi:hypothetical protein